MKREGRQHGVVRSYSILTVPLSHRRSVLTVDSASAAGLFSKVPRKPTNQSKFTGRCGGGRCSGCRINPPCKSKDKGKGTMKLRSVDAKPGFVNYPAGSSATGVLAYLANDGDYDDDYEGTYDENYDYDNDDGTPNFDLGFEIAPIVTVDDDDNGGVRFYDVGLCWGDGDGDEYEDDGWYLVGLMH